MTKIYIAVAISTIVTLYYLYKINVIDYVDEEQKKD